MKRKAQSRSWKKWLVGFLGAIILVLVSITVWVNMALKQPSRTYAPISAYVYKYELTQTPGSAVSGRTTIYRFHITENDQPVANHAVTVGTSHAYGIFMNGRTSDVFEQHKTTDANGYVEVTFTPKLWTLLADKAFGVYAAPDLTPAENDAMNRKILNHELPVGVEISATFSIPAIYPRWLGWFMWR
jgi:hypothetical protein